MNHLFNIRNLETGKTEHTKLSSSRRKSKLFWSSINMMIVFSSLDSRCGSLDSNNFFTDGPVINLTYILECFPGKVNITVVAESRQSSACPKEATEQQNLNWKDTVVKSLLVEVCAYKSIKHFQKRNKLNM